MHSLSSLHDYKLKENLKDILPVFFPGVYGLLESLKFLVGMTTLEQPQVITFMHFITFCHFDSLNSISAYTMLSDFDMHVN